MRAGAMAQTISVTRSEMDETGRIAGVMAECSQSLHDTVHNVLTELRAA